MKLERDAFIEWLKAEPEAHGGYSMTSSIINYSMKCPIATYLNNLTISKCQVGFKGYLVGREPFNLPKWAVDFIDWFDNISRNEIIKRKNILWYFENVKGNKENKLNELK